MNIFPLLAELRSRDIRVWVDGDRLRCDAPPGVLTPDLRARLSASKVDLLDFLRNADSLGQQHRAIVPLQPRGRHLPIFGVGGHNGDAFVFRTMARCLGPEQPFFGLQLPGADGQSQPMDNIEKIGAYLAEQVLSFRPQGPYLLAGYCAGGTIAFELAQQLRRRGAIIGLLALIACPHPQELRGLPKARRFFQEQWGRVRKHAPALLLSPAAQRRYLAAALERHRAHMARQEERLADPVLAQRRRVEQATLAALARYRPARYPGLVHLFLPGPDWSRAGGLAARWRHWTGSLNEYHGPLGATGDDIIMEVHGPAFTEIFRQCLGDGADRP